MAEYIEREAFIESQHHLYCENCARRKDGKGKFVYDIGDAPCRACGIMDVLDAVEDFPAADVRPVVRARWRYKTMTVPGGKGQTYAKWCCTVCKGKAKERTRFCPNCGALMEES